MALVRQVLIRIRGRWRNTSTRYQKRRGDQICHGRIRSGNSFAAHPCHKSYWYLHKYVGHSIRSPMRDPNQEPSRLPQVDLSRKDAKTSHRYAFAITRVFGQSGHFIGAFSVPSHGRLPVSEDRIRFGTIFSAGTHSHGT